MLKFLILSLLFVALSSALQITVVNNVASCPNGNYGSTLKLFFTNYGQKDIAKGTSYLVTSGQLDLNNGLGIQENGEYCRSNGAEPPCLNPDNAGMQLKINGPKCTDYVLNNPFYCGAHPPNAKNILNVAMSGAYPNCVATLTRKAGVNCQFSC